MSFLALVVKLYLRCWTRCVKTSYKTIEPNLKAWRTCIKPIGRPNGHANLLVSGSLSIGSENLKLFFFLWNRKNSAKNFLGIQTPPLKESRSALARDFCQVEIIFFKFQLSRGLGRKKNLLRSSWRRNQTKTRKPHLLRSESSLRLLVTITTALMFLPTPKKFDS